MNEIDSSNANDDDNDDDNDDEEEQIEDDEAPLYPYLENVDIDANDSSNVIQQQAGNIDHYNSDYNLIHEQADDDNNHVQPPQQQQQQQVAIEPPADAPPLYDIDQIMVAPAPPQNEPLEQQAVRRDVLPSYREAIAE